MVGFNLDFFPFAAMSFLTLLYVRGQWTFLPTAYVVRGKVMFWHGSVCLSTPRGGTWARSRWGVPKPGPGGGGVPEPGPGGGVPKPGPGGGVPQPGPGGGYPNWGVPNLRYPPIRPGQGGTQWGVPTSGTPPPIRPSQGVYPDGGSTPPLVPPRSDLARGVPSVRVPHQVVLDTPWSVCLLRSRRRTFLFSKFLQLKNKNKSGNLRGIASFCAFFLCFIGETRSKNE